MGSQQTKAFTFWVGGRRYIKTSTTSLEKLKKKHLYYLASPFSHKNKKIEREREIEIGKIAGKLIVNYKLHLITPITSSHRLRQLNRKLGTNWDFWKHQDEKYIQNCQGVIVAMMDGWRESVGVTAEIKIADRLNIPVYYLNPKTLKLEERLYAIYQTRRQTRTRSRH